MSVTPSRMPIPWISPGPSPGWSRDRLTRSDSGLSKGTTLSVRGRSLAPWARGRIAPSGTNAARLRASSWDRRECWFSTAFTKDSGAPSGRLRNTSARPAIAGSSRVSRSAARWPRIRRPAAGKPTSTRASTKPGPEGSPEIRIAVRSRTSWPPASIRIRPLWPDPAELPAWGIARRNPRARKSARAVRRARLEASAAGKPAVSPFIRTRTREGGAKGSRATRSTNTVISVSRRAHSPSRSR